MTKIKTRLTAMLAGARVRLVSRAFFQGALGGLALYTAGAQIDPSIVAHISWWKGAMSVGAAGGVGSVAHNYLPLLNRILPLVKLPPAPPQP